MTWPDYPEKRLEVLEIVVLSSVMARATTIVCNTPDYGVEEVADTACAMILTAIRQVVHFDIGRVLDVAGLLGL